MVKHIIRWTYRSTFPLWQKLGFHVTPNHFYFPVPDTTQMRPAMWERPSAMVGVDMNEAGQLALLELFERKFKTEYERFPREKTSVPHQYYVNNTLYESVDGETLYCMVREFKPKRIIEVGSGNSTYVTAQAKLKNLAENAAAECQLTSIEPYPNAVLRKGFPGLDRLIISKVQDVPLAEFDVLEDGDFLVIDSSHVLAVGSDVEYLFLEVVPRLKNGVFIHTHDIFLPAQYPKQWVFNEFVFYTEQQLLQAFLAFNDSFQVLWGGAYMNIRHQEKLIAAIPSYIKGATLPGSFWMRRVK